MGSRFRYFKIIWQKPSDVRAKAAINVETVSIDIDCDAITDGDAGDATPADAMLCLALLQGGRNTNARVIVVAVWCIWKSDLSSIASGWRIDRHKRRRDVSALDWMNATWGIMYTIGISTHSDRSVHTAPLYTAPHRWKINYSFARTATIAAKWNIERRMPICRFLMSNCFLRENKILPKLMKKCEFEEEKIVGNDRFLWMNIWVSYNEKIADSCWLKF